MFIPKYNLTSETPVTEKHLIANSKTVSVGDAVELASGLVDLCDTSSTAVYGIVVGFVNEDGTPVTGQADTTGNTVVTASDNVTVGKIHAVVNTSKEQVYLGTLDAAAGTTTGSDVYGALFDFANEHSIDESSVGAGGLLQVVGFDTADATKVYVKINVSATRG